MYRFERVLLYFMIIFLSIGWITNPLLENLVSRNIGIFGFLGLGTYFLFNYIYKNSEGRSLLNFAIEFFISGLLIIIVVIIFILLS